MKKISIFMTLVSIVLIVLFVNSFRKEVQLGKETEVASIKEILSKGYVKILFVNYDDHIIIGELPDGSKKKVHVIFAERRPSVGELWRVVEDKQRLRLTTQYLP